MSKDFSEVERYAAFPVFLLVDVSLSMRREIPVLNEGLQKIKQALKNAPIVAEKARLGVIIFADEARTVLPLCDLQYADMPPLKEEGSGTNFAKAFRVTRHEIEAQISSLGKGYPFHTPVVYFLTDGEHNASDDWTKPHEQLTSREWKFYPQIVAFGFRDAKREDLQSIGTAHVLLAKDGSPADQLEAILNTIIGSIKFTSLSLHAADTGQATEGGLGVPIDHTKFISLPTKTV